MVANLNTCAHCRSPIVDATTQVIHGDRTFCCPNCAAAMEQVAGGSERQAPAHAGEFRCAHCDAPIVDESTLEEQGDQVFCCRNCAVAMGMMGSRTGDQPGATWQA